MELPKGHVLVRLEDLRAQQIDANTIEDLNHEVNTERGVANNLAKELASVMTQLASVENFRGQLTEQLRSHDAAWAEVDNLLRVALEPHSQANVVTLVAIIEQCKTIAMKMRPNGECQPVMNFEELRG